MNDTVLVIGAGITGMQASVELLKQGFKVCLLEKEPHIGGKMAIIDRVFPTNEHTACALQQQECNNPVFRGASVPPGSTWRF